MYLQFICKTNYIMKFKILYCNVQKAKELETWTYYVMGIRIMRSFKKKQSAHAKYILKKGSIALVSGHLGSLILAAKVAT